MKTLNNYHIPEGTRYALYLVVLLSVLLAFISCGSDDDDEISLVGANISISDISGSWTATSVLIGNLTPDSQPLSVDVIDEGGSVTLTVQSNGRYTLTIKRPTRADDVFTGPLGFEGEWLVIGYDSDPEEYNYWFIELSTNGNNLTLRGESTYDFNEDDVEDPASYNLELVRN
ncbi:hypothetical protein [Aquimarina celericrescens]|uniref:Lipocalin-like domain-containing protein n=1 Tax=Aquimarina celericrescens TaxID=1964542 RepID=A0ABW5AX17_9FLAO|nr:hypothetical protein [Aquimarina celericrescens]